MSPVNQYSDLRGVPVTASDRKLVDQLDKAATLFHGYFADPVAAVDQALERDPTFIMGLVLKGGIFATSSEKAAEPVLDDILARLKPLAASANARERGHIAALEAWRAGRFDAAVESWGRVLLEYPRDLIALQFAHLGDFLLAQSLTLRDRPARVLHAWDSKVPGYGFVLGMWAFGLEESGHYPEAERTGRDALELNPRDPWSVHAVAHVMEMQNRVDEGIAWLEARTADWAPENLFAFHNWWHLALYHLDGERSATALELYDTRIRPKPSPVVLEMVDASALLWRLQLLEVDAGGRWNELADSWTPNLTDGYYAFNDVHAMMALVGARRLDEARRLVAALEKVAVRATLNGEMTRLVGLPAARALLAFGESRYQDALEHLMPALPVAQRHGGSHAQRDVLQLTAAEAALRGGRESAARALVSQRLASRPKSQHNLALARRSGLSRPRA
jgi:tetratricopeptide (TPR) repeat protein